VDLPDVAARLGVPIEEVERVHRLAGDQPSSLLPAKADAPAILDRLAVRRDDAAEILAGWPDSDYPLWTPELCWLLDRSTALVRADLGATAGSHPGRGWRERGLAWWHL
jgi:predicted trehalose synthase